MMMADQQGTDWAGFYKAILSQVPIPATTSQDYGGSQVVVRDLLVNLGDVYAAIREQGLRPRTVSVYADVVKVSGSINPLISDTGLLIAARRIEVDPGSSILLDYRTSQIGKLIVYVGEVAGPLQAKAVAPSNDSSQVTVFDLSTPQTVGVVVSYSGTATTTPLTSFDDSGLDLGSPMRISLGTIFQFATATFYVEPEIARSMLGWIMAVTSGSIVARDLFLQSSALLAQLNASTSSVTFVPYLDKDVYASVASSFLPAALAYETQYQRFSDKKETVADRQAAANLMLKNYQDTIKLNAQLLSQAQANLLGAQKALAQAEVALKIEQSKATDAGIGFDYGTKIWVREEIIKAVLSMAGALVEFVAAIGLMVVGDEAAGAQAAGAVAQGAKAASSAQDVAKEVQQVSKFAQVMKDLADLMNKLKGVGEALQKMYASVKEIMAAANDISRAVSVTDINIPFTDDISGQADWDAFRVQADALIQPAIDQDVPGAVEYQVELDKLAIYGKAYMASQVAVVQAGQEFVRLTLQKQVSVNQEARLRQYVAQLSDQSQYDDQLMQLFFERELNIKRWLFIAIQNYTLAFRYWALRDSRVQLSVVKPVSELQEDLGTITQEYADTLQSFNPPPQQVLGKKIVIPDTNEGLYKDVVANLRQNSSTTFPVLLDDAAFQGLGRVRLHRIRVWLDGVADSDDKPIYVDVTHSGAYSDQLHGTTYSFAAAPYERAFEYSGAPGDVTKIQLDGIVDTHDQYAYFEPTPFTQWTVAVPTHQNPAVDLSTLTSITLDLAGSAIAMPGVATQAGTAEVVTA